MLNILKNYVYISFLKLMVVFFNAAATRKKKSRTAHFPSHFIYRYLIVDKQQKQHAMYFYTSHKEFGKNIC